MIARVKKSSPKQRLQLGASVLSAARVVDTRPVKERLERFERVHAEYVEAQQKVEAGKTEAETAQARLSAGAKRQEKAVENLARALVTDGQARGNPFETFGAPAPSVVTKPAPALAAKAVHQLVTAVLAHETNGKRTIEAARAADKAARSVEQAVAAVKKTKDDLRGTRRMRDAVGESWESALAALKRVASAVAEEGAPDVYVKLFPPVARAAPKTKTEEQPQNGTPVTPAPTPTPVQSAA